jgi:hypothetical protein
MTRANFWSEKTVKSMTADELIKWYNEIFKNLEAAKKFNMTLKSERAFDLIEKELIRRKIL